MGVIHDETIEELHRKNYIKSASDLGGAPAPTPQANCPDTSFRVYEEANETVKQLYRENHRKQTYTFVQQQKAKYNACRRPAKRVWEVLEWLDAIHDDSDPDTDASQIQHGLQSAEAARKDGQPRWFILVCLIHDLGKVLLEYGEPQWAVVGDTFPGCAFSDKIVLSTYFKENPDTVNPTFNTPFGLYTPHCGLDQVHMSYGHDEYLYHVVRPYVPAEAAYIIRYHSFYAAHRENAYEHLYADKDRAMMPWVKRFNRYDLYTKSDALVDKEAVLPYYKAVVQEFFPDPIPW